MDIFYKMYVLILYPLSCCHLNRTHFHSNPNFPLVGNTTVWNNHHPLCTYCMFCLPIQMERHRYIHLQWCTYLYEQYIKIVKDKGKYNVYFKMVTKIMFKIFLCTYSTNLWVCIPHYHDKRSQRCMNLAWCHHQYIHQQNSLCRFS